MKMFFIELAQAAALWANGGLKDGSAEAAANVGLDASSMAVKGGSTDPAATSANSAASAKSSPSASTNVLSTSQIFCTIFLCYESRALFQEDVRVFLAVCAHIGY
jgi:hypothetical protein